MARTTKKTAKKAAKKTATKKAPAKKAAAKPASGSGGPARSALRGGHVDAERYSKDPAAVNERVGEKADKAIAQLANMVARFEAKGEDNTPEVKKARKAMEHFEAAKKALA
jgi:RNA polymerase primary sigma factor